MIRFLVLLPLCLPAAPTYPEEPAPPVHEDSQPVRDPEALPDPDPVAFMENCLRRYDQEVQGYACIMSKQERVNGHLYPEEIIQAYFKERPFSVFMRWLKGARQAKCALYVQGKNDGNMLILPTSLARFGIVLPKDPKGAEARQSGRYLITEFGIKIGMKRTLESWLEARAHHALHIEYLGVYRVAKAGERPCYKLRRTKYAHPEVDGITELTLYIDTQTWLQVGSELRDAKGELIAEYYFRDIHLNPRFAPNQFERSALTSDGSGG